MLAFADVWFGHDQQQTNIVFQPPPSTTINNTQHHPSPTAATCLHQPQTTTHSTRPLHCMPTPTSWCHITRAAHGDDDVPCHLDSDDACHCHCQVSLITLQPPPPFLTQEAGPCHLFNYKLQWSTTTEQPWCTLTTTPPATTSWTATNEANLLQNYSPIWLPNRLRTDTYTFPYPMTHFTLTHYCMIWLTNCA